MLKNILLRKKGNSNLFALLIIIVSIALTSPLVFADGEKIMLLQGDGEGGFVNGGSFDQNGWTVENGSETNRCEVGIAEPPGSVSGQRSVYISTVIRNCTLSNLSERSKQHA